VLYAEARLRASLLQTGLVASNSGCISYRKLTVVPGARFGPYGIRSGARRQTKARGFNVPLNVNPYDEGYSFVRGSDNTIGRQLRLRPNKLLCWPKLDCGDVPASPYDTTLAIEQIEAAYSSLIQRSVANHDVFATKGALKGLDGEWHPRVASLGGDHTIVRDCPIRSSQA
jgi:agmatinase